MKGDYMSNNVYDRLKWIALIFIPSLETLILALGKIWAFPYYVEIGATVAAIGVFLGGLLGVSCYNYYLTDEGEEENDTGNDREETEGEDN